MRTRPIDPQKRDDERSIGTVTLALEQLAAWMQSDEDEYLEFKEAKGGFHFEKLVKYCAALANEGGGRIILGVTDQKPRQVVGTGAFSELERTKAGLIERLHLRIECQALDHPDGRVLVFTAPPRPIGMPIQYEGAFWMRGGEDLVPMTPDMLKRIFDESHPDYSAEICSKASPADLHPEAIEAFRQMWLRRSGNEALAGLSHEQLLRDAELLIEGAPTYAALVLFGTHRALGRHLGQAEVVFEYRSSEGPLPYQQREECREGFFLFQDTLWNTINLRNDKHHFLDGLVMRQIPTLNESVVREAILNAVSHREYRLSGSVFVRQFPTKIEVVSPGGLPPGVTVDNILWQQAPRNRRIAETFARCGLVERSGQGANRMFEQAIRESKELPDFSRTDDYQVFLTLHGTVQDPAFVRFLEQVSKETQASFDTADLLVLDHIHREQAVPGPLQDRLPVLRDLGAVERFRRKHVLSRRFYALVGKKGVYTRKRGLDRETNKALLLKHIRDNEAEGSPLRELLEVLPALTHSQVRMLLREMRHDGHIHLEGRARTARWLPGPAQEDPGT